jgi:shikimate dehydrogenase
MKIENIVSGKTKVVGVIGCPIEHSISPHLHNMISSKLGVDLIYVPFRVEKPELENAVKGLKALNLVGFNVTVPYKKEIMKFIDDNSKEALLMGAVNTIKNIDGRFYGYNTDAEGFSRAYKEIVKSGFRGKRITLLGAGGAARAISVKVAKEGAEKISIINRSIEKAFDITEIINNNFNKIAKAYSNDDSQVNKVFSESDIIINATPIGMYPEIGASPLNKKMKLTKEQIVYDTIYNPVKTKLLQEAQKAGAMAVNGLGMLFYQGVFAYEIWTGIKITEEIIKELFTEFTKIVRQ